MTPMERLALDVATMFVLSDAGRLLHENEPTPSPAPRACLLGCGEGVLVRVRQDVGAKTAAAIASLAEASGGWTDATADPTCLASIVELLEEEAPVSAVDRSIIYGLPHRLQARSPVPIVRCGTEAGDALIDRLQREGPPQPLADAGFVDVGEFWAPWCVAMEGQDIAAIAFAARLSEGGAELGVYTLAAYRGRGLAGTVTAAWSALPELAERELFYSTSVANRASQRVAEGLGLQVIGAGLRIN